MNYFPSRWPIMCAVMNGASDLKLALAISEAGAMPSLMVVDQDNNARLEQLDRDLTEFVKSTGQANIVLQLDYSDICNKDYVGLVKKHNVSHIEIFGLTQDITKNELNNIFIDPRWAIGYQLLQKYSKITFRMINVFDMSNTNADAYALKGSDSGGFTGELTTKELFDQQRKLIPDKNLIPYGGIGTPEQVKYYIDNGACGVAVGTLFAASKESRLAESVKQKMVAVNSSSLIKFETKQQALIFGDREVIFNDNTLNRQQNLENGIAGVGGHVYFGKSIDYITEIRSVKEIVDYLTDLIR